jgi:hypothetical protein
MIYVHLWSACKHVALRDAEQVDFLDYLIALQPD